MNSCGSYLYNITTSSPVDPASTISPWLPQWTFHTSEDKQKVRALRCHQVGRAGCMSSFVPTCSYSFTGQNLSRDPPSPDWKVVRKQLIHPPQVSSRLCYIPERTWDLFIKNSLGLVTIKNLPAIWETWVWSLGWEDPLEKRIAIHSSILAWRIAWTEEPGRLQSTGLQRVGHNWVTNTLLTTM